MNTLVDFATALKASQDTARRAQVHQQPKNQNAPTGARARAIASLPAHECSVVEYICHPGRPGFTQVTIYGPTASAVQLQIDRTMRHVESDGYSAHFEGPRRALTGFGAVGEINEYVPEPGE